VFICLHVWDGLRRKSDGGDCLFNKGPFGGEEYISCMTRTTLPFFVLYLLLIWLYFVCCQGLRSGLYGTEKKYCTAKRSDEKFKEGNRFDLLSKPSRQTRSPKNNDPGVKEGICKVIGFGSTGVQFASSLQSRHPKTA
jgi:hypothetical protein